MSPFFFYSMLVKFHQNRKRIYNSLLATFVYLSILNRILTRAREVAGKMDFIKQNSQILTEHDLYRG
jgi:hypothetical protein